VCWLKQEKLAELACVSVKTVVRVVKFLKENGVIKIYHTKRSNGLNGHSYYVLQKFEGDLPLDDEEIVAIEERNVGVEDVVGDYETAGGVVLMYHISGLGKVETRLFQ
jgi:DNA-binding Lrp family transcriptional regulator